jgi:hypothetical protein
MSIRPFRAWRAVCDSCGVLSEEYYNQEDVSPGIIRNGWWISDTTSDCSTRCPECKDRIQGDSPGTETGGRKTDE